MGAVLNVVGRPKSFGSRVVSFIEQGIDCLQYDRPILLRILNRLSGYFVFANLATLQTGNADFFQSFGYFDTNFAEVRFAGCHPDQL